MTWRVLLSRKCGSASSPSLFFFSHSKNSFPSTRAFVSPHPLGSTHPLAESLMPRCSSHLTNMKANFVSGKCACGWKPRFDSYESEKVANMQPAVLDMRSSSWSISGLQQVWIPSDKKKKRPLSRLSFSDKRSFRLWTRTIQYTHKWTIYLKVHNSIGPKGFKGVSHLNDLRLMLTILTFFLKS